MYDTTQLHFVDDIFLQLSIFVVNDDPSLIEEGSGKSTVDVLRQFLSRRWNADSKYLNLEAIADDAILQDAGIEPLKKDDSNNVGSALMKLAGEMFPEVGLSLHCFSF